MYLTFGDEYFKTEQFWIAHRVTRYQADYDKEYLFGILLTATINLQHKTILKYEESRDGIFAWHEFK